MAFPVLATYRLQLRGASSGFGFTFADAENLLDYLDDLGVSHLYLSPILTPVAGSAHGYDVTELQPERTTQIGEPVRAIVELPVCDDLSVVHDDRRPVGRGFGEGAWIHVPLLTEHRMKTTEKLPVPGCTSVRNFLR